jgi:ubiquinone/menaquinone biosynthesis C-methylase UbiE
MKSIPPGVLRKNYALGRKTKRAWKYRVKRRTHEIIQAIYKHNSSKINAILDIGAAEGLMLGSIKKEFPQAQCIGLEYSQELIDINQDKNINFIQGDAQNLPFENSSFDIAVAVAIIEHLSKPEKMILECHRVLRRDGICIFTTPDPFFERIATKIDNLKEEQHQRTFQLSELVSLLKSKSFKILKAEKFMMSPIGFPCEIKIEKIMKIAGLGVLLLNQLVVGQK